MSEKGLTFANSSALRELRQFRFRRVWIYPLNLSQYEVGTVSKVILGTSGGRFAPMRPGKRRFK
jgi:hypothetical protein